jgi:hypothetical protein
VLDLNERREITLLNLALMESRLSTLQRLASDERMRFAYPHLIEDFDNDKKFQVFFRAALEALRGGRKCPISSPKRGSFVYRKSLGTPRPTLQRRLSSQLRNRLVAAVNG